MFESLKPRKEELSVEDFENWKIDDPELQTLTLNVTSKMQWEVDDEGSAVAFEPNEGYEGALKDLMKHLDNKGHRYSEKAITTALADILDVGDYGYTEVVN